MIGNNIQIYDDIKIIERPLSSEGIEKIGLTQPSKPKNISLYSFNKCSDGNFQSPYSRKKSDILDKNVLCQSTTKNPVKNQIIDSSYDPVSIIEKLQNTNETQNGLSGQEIAKLRGELLENIKPEVLDNMQKIISKRNKEREQKMSAEVELISKIKRVCEEPQKEILSKMDVDVEKMSNERDDLSFLPISEYRKYPNMNKLERDKLEWMRFIDAKAEKAKSVHIRFHFNGHVIDPHDVNDVNTEEEKEMCEKFLKEQECQNGNEFSESLRHHGEEPAREGYTISELFWLSRSSFAQQRHLAVDTLVNILLRSRALEHAHWFNMPTVTQALVDCGIVFLARWLLDDAGIRQQHLLDAIKLLYVILVDDSDGKTETLLFSWPNHHINYSIYRKMSQSATAENRYRLSLDKSERTEIQDDVLMFEDVVYCLVYKTHLLTRLCWLLTTADVRIPMETERKLIEILQRIAGHCLETANELCNQNDELIRLLVEHHIIRNTTHCTDSMLKLVRILCQQSQSLAVKLMRDQSIVTAVYSFLTNERQTDHSVKIESIRLISILILRGIHSGPIAVILSALLNDLLDLLGAHDSFALTSAVVNFVNACLLSKMTVPSDLVPLMEEVISSARHRVINVDNSNYDPYLLASLIHLQILFFQRWQLVSTTVSVSEATNQFWTNFLHPLIESGLSERVFTSAADQSILGYSHRHTDVHFIRTDLQNLLSPSAPLALLTSNPKFVDRRPFFITIHQDICLLSAVAHAFSSLPSYSSLRYQLSPSLNKYLLRVANTPPSFIVPQSTPYTASIQLELETMASVLIFCAKFGVITSTTMDIMYRCALRILPCMGPSLRDLGIKLFSNVIFNPDIVRTVSNSLLPTDIQLRLLESLPLLTQAYLDCFPLLNEQGTSNELVLLHNRWSIDECLVPARWYDSIVIHYHRQYTTNKQQTSDLLNFSLVIDSLCYVMFIETGGFLDNTNKQLDLAVGLRRLLCALIPTDLTEVMGCESIPYRIIEYFTKQYLVDLSQLDLVKRIDDVSFNQLYIEMVDQYFQSSFSEPLPANLVLFFCAMRFPSKNRVRFWSYEFDKLRMFRLTIAESIVPFTEYIRKDEKDSKVLHLYWEALRQNAISESCNELLYWIAIHHLNRFVYDQEIIVREKPNKHWMKLKNIVMDENADEKCLETVKTILAKKANSGEFIKLLAVVTDAKLSTEQQWQKIKKIVMKQVFADSRWQELKKVVIQDISNNRLQTIAWIKHVKMYKQFSADCTPLFYDILPNIRQQYLTNFFESNCK